MAQLHTLKQKTHALNTEIYASYLAYKDSRVKWYIPVLLAFVIGYALSPIDFIPDLVAVFGFLDDVIIVALGFSISYHLIDKTILNETRLKAYEEIGNNQLAYRIIGYFWILALTLLFMFCYKFMFIQLL
ncbi:YkvA family protein [Pontibacter arcticus]|uniref:DUF1232 domain-containing protein n=1 Tax=Pontibacter arcticus TaxID=2080288 RepID=A0A364RI07_9BACT|nr:YkvA family protein [Pontibacter arcticus]RAU83917.1 DUF1232 domain-containing protein [Pontibacter arcticus]